VDEFLQQLAERLKVYDAEIITADETADWPTGKLDELVETGVLAEIQHSKGVVCNECEENCFIEPDIRTIPDTSEASGVFVCTRNPDIGRIKVDLDQLRQWRISTQKLSELGYQVQLGWIVPWNETNTEYFTLKEAVSLANDDSITVRSMSRLLEDLEFPVHRMHKGRRCMVHIADFRKWLQYAHHGKITDKAIEKYLNGAEKRKKASRKKKAGS
jgi:hypothetical protein